mgnify:CR=1 FL=1
MHILQFYEKCARVEFEIHILVTLIVLIGR